MITTVGLAWIAIPWLACFVLLSYLLFPLLGLINVILISYTVSSALSGWVIYLLSCCFGGVSLYLVYISLILFSLSTVPFLYRVIYMYIIRYRLWKGEIKNSTCFGIVLAVNFAIAWYLFHYHYLHELEGVGWMSGGTTWGDIPLHMSIIQSLLYGANKYFHGFFAIPMSPIFAKEPLPISFFPHFHRASMITTGLTMRESFILPNLLLVSSFVGLLFQYYNMFFHEKRALAVMSTIFAMLNGGLGFILWIFVYGMNVRVNMDLDFLERWRVDEQFPLPWWGMYGHILLPQLDAIYAYPLFVSVLILLYKGLEKSIPLQQSLWIMGTAGFITILISIYHVYSYYFICILSVSFIITTPKEIWKAAVISKWFIFGLVSSIGNIPILYYFGGSALEGKATISVSLFWNAYEFLPQMFRGFPSFVVPFIFWSVTLGAFIPLAIIGMFNLDIRQLRCIKASWVVFILPNVISFQTFTAQNLKFFSLWTLVASASVSAAVYAIWKKYPGEGIRILVVLCCFTLIFSGCLAIRRDIKQYAQVYNSEDLEAGKWIMENTSNDAIFLSSELHTNPASMIAGRSMFASFEGWMIAHEYNHYAERFELQRKILYGDPNIRINRELRKHNISYVMIDPELFATKEYNPGFWDATFPLLYSSTNYRIYSATIINKSKS